MIKNLYKGLKYVKCGFCGKAIPADPYLVKENDKEGVFCSKECYQFYMDFPRVLRKFEQEVK